MKSLIFILAITVSLQASARCFNYIFSGGSKNRVDKVGLEARTSYVKNQGRRLNCLTLESIDESYSTLAPKFQSFIKDNNFNSRRDKLHISILAHGGPTQLQLLNNTKLKYGAFLDLIDSTMPKGSDVTFAAQSCKPRFNHNASMREFKNLKSFCGATASSGRYNAIIYNGTKESLRLSEFVPAGMNAWIQGRGSRTIYNLYIEGGRSSTRNMVRNPRTSSQWFARHTLNQMGMRSTITPFKDFIEGKTEYARMSYEDLNLTSRPVQLLMMWNRTPFNFEAKDYLNIYKILQDHSEINSHRIFKEIEQTYPNLSYIGRTYTQRLRWLNQNWNGIAHKIKTWHERRANGSESLFNACDIAKQNRECPRFTRQLGAALRYEMSVFRELNDFYIVAKLWKENRAAFARFAELRQCEQRDALDQ